MSLRHYLRTVVTVGPDDSIATAASRLCEAHVGCVVVVRERRPIGMLTDRDLVVRVLAKGCSPATTKVSEVVTYEPFVVRDSEGIETALRTMREHGVRRLPIVDDAGELVGIVTADDLTVMLGRRMFQLAQSIEGNADSADTR